MGQNMYVRDLEPHPNVRGAQRMKPKRKRFWIARGIFRTLRRFVEVLVILVLLILLFVTPKTEEAHFDKESAQGIAYTPPVSVVPGPTIPQALSINHSNNVLDIAEYKGEYYLGFRTAPTHFASRKAKIIVLRSPDRKQWVKDAEFQFGCDVRETRLMVFKDKLFLYFFQAGKNPFGFSPKSIFATERNPEGGWTQARPIYKPGYVVWRAKAYGDTAYMSVYYGKGLYDFWKEKTGELRLLTSTDGYDWQPVSEKPQVTEMGAEEGDFEFDDQGNLVAVVRLEMSGALVCTASKDNLGLWTTAYTPYKYDSPLLFRHNGTMYLVARRNIAGPFNREWNILPEFLQRAWNHVCYSSTRKRTSLYKVDPIMRKVIPLFDFPSTGDTSIAAITPLDRQSYCLMYYSTPIGGRDMPWFFGQLFGANIYETTLTLP